MGDKFKLITRGNVDYGDGIGLRWVLLHFSGQPINICNSEDDPEVIDFLNMAHDCILAETKLPFYESWSGGPGQYFQNAAYFRQVGKWLLVKQRYGYDI